MNTQNQNMPTQSPAKAFQVYMQKYKSQLEMALPKHMTADRMMRLTLTEFSKNPKLQQCSSNSIFSSIIIASQLGLEPGVNGQGYLVPYNGTCTFIPGWKGLVDLAQRGGRSSVWTGAVYEGDEFDYMLGDSPYCRHKPCGEFDESKLTHVYAIGRVKDSEMPIIEVWPVRKVREHFKKTVVKGLQPNHYSHKHFEAYAKKVALLQVLKYMPQSIELSNAVDVSSAVEQGKGVTIDGDFVNVESNTNTENEATHVEAYQQPKQIEQAATYAQQPQQHYEPQPQEQVQEESLKPTFAMIKHSILTVKSPAHLDFCEEQALDHDHSEERKQLMQLVRAQREKFNPAQAAAATPVVEAKKPEPQVEQQPEPEKKPTSAELKKQFAKALNNAKDLREVAAIESQIACNEILNDKDRKYLEANVQQVEQKLTPVEEAPAVEFNETELEVTKFKEQIEAAQTPEALTKIRATFSANGTLSDEQHKELHTALNQKMATLTKPKTVDLAKSQAVANNLSKMISDAATVEVLETTIASSINAHASQMTVEHLNQVKSAYAERKTFLENQISMFDDSYYEIAVEKIQRATTEQDVFDITMSPDFAELDKEEQRMLNSMANQKLNQIQQG